MGVQVGFPSPLTGTATWWRGSVLPLHVGDSGRRVRLWTPVALGVNNVDVRAVGAVVNFDNTLDMSGATTCLFILRVNSYTGVGGETVVAGIRLVSPVKIHEGATAHLEAVYHIDNGAALAVANLTSDTGARCSYNQTLSGTGDSVYWAKAHPLLGVNVELTLANFTTCFMSIAAFAWYPGR